MSYYYRFDKQQDHKPLKSALYKNVACVHVPATLYINVYSDWSALQVNHYTILTFVRASVCHSGMAHVKFAK